MLLRNQGVKADLTSGAGHNSCAVLRASNKTFALDWRENATQITTGSFGDATAIAKPDEDSLRFAGQEFRFGTCSRIAFSRISQDQTITASY